MSPSTHGLLRRAVAIAIGALALLAPLRVSAQRDTSAALVGRVTMLGGQGIPEVEIVDQLSGRIAVTDADGRYALDRLVEGPRHVVVRRIGWVRIDTTLTLHALSRLEVDFVMSQVVQRLGAVNIISQDECPNRTMEGFECRRRAAIGVFRDAKELAALNPRIAADMLWGIDGLRREGDAVLSTTQWRCLTILIDGRPRNVGDGALRMSDYIAVEFYDAGAKVPAWYKSYAYQESRPATPRRRGSPTGGIGRSLPTPAAPAHPCALAVFWTKFAPKIDPSMDPSPSVTQARAAVRGLTPDSTPPKKPDTP